VAWRRIPAVRAWIPPIEMYEEEHEFAVKAEEEVKNEDYYLCKRRYGGFERSLTLPSEVDTGKI
jgi:HSP20 family molecular chaperone IbpA